MKRGSSKGYTLIEVMITGLVLALGIMAIMAMLTASLESNGIAQETTVANSLAEQTVELLRLDALRWNHNGTVGLLDLDDTTYLKSASLGKGWVTYKAARLNDYMQASADGGDSALFRFCVFYRYDWAGNMVSDGGNTVNELLRVDVVVAWPRRLNNFTGLFSNCSGTPSAIAAFLAPANNTATRQIRMSTYIRRNPLTK